MQSKYVKLIQNATLILWDECLMILRHAFEALDRSLRDIMGAIDKRYKDIPFVNKIIVFGGDFRQIFPVVRKGSRSDIIKASFNRSPLWPNIQVLKLTINMRIQRMASIDQLKAKEFSENLYELETNMIRTINYCFKVIILFIILLKSDPISSYDDLIKLPKEIASSMMMVQLIEHTYPNIMSLRSKTCKNAYYS